MLGMPLPQQRKLNMLDKLDMPGQTPKKPKNSSEFLKKLPVLKKLVDLMDMLKQSNTTFKKFTMVLTSTTMFLNQDFTLLNLNSTTSNTKLNSLKKLDKLGKMLLLLPKLINSITVLSLGHKLTSSKTYTTNLNILERFSNNMSLFPTFPNLGKTISEEELNST